MKPLVPYEKLSKSKQRERDRLKRADWNGVNPVTRKSVNTKKYDRVREKNRLNAEMRRSGGIFLFTIKKIILNVTQKYLKYQLTKRPVVHIIMPVAKPCACSSAG